MSFLKKRTYHSIKAPLLSILGQYKVKLSLIEPFNAYFSIFIEGHSNRKPEPKASLSPLIQLVIKIN